MRTRGCCADEEGPPCSNYLERLGEVAHPFELASGFIQNGE